MDAIHLDPKYYDDPSGFHPFRFCRADVVRGTRTQSYYDARGLDSTMPGSSVHESLAGANKSSATLDAKFLSFGFGRYACPGRFFALHEIKLMIAHIVLNYDIQYFEKRPEQFKVMWVQLPHDSTNLAIRRRWGAV